MDNKMLKKQKTIFYFLKRTLKIVLNYIVLLIEKILRNNLFSQKMNTAKKKSFFRKYFATVKTSWLRNELERKFVNIKFYKLDFWQS